MSEPAPREVSCSDLARSTSPEVAGACGTGVPTLVLVPVGSIEQHGPHLPLDTDTVIATAVARRAAALLDRPGVHVAPALSYGSSGEHQHFAGTCSIGTDALRVMVVELTRSLRTWADRVVFVNAHGGNGTALRAGIEQLVAEGHHAAWVACATEAPLNPHADLHAGRTETSLMLHLAPTSVRRELAAAGTTAPLAEILPAMLAGGIIAVSANGVLGDPAGACAEEGAELLEAMAGDVVTQVLAGVEAGVVVA